METQQRRDKSLTAEVRSGRRLERRKQRGPWKRGRVSFQVGHGRAGSQSARRLRSVAESTQTCSNPVVPCNRQGTTRTHMLLPVTAQRLLPASNAGGTPQIRCLWTPAVLRQFITPNCLPFLVNLGQSTFSLKHLFGAEAERDEH